MSKQQTEAQYLVQWMEAVPLGSVDERVVTEMKRLESVNDELLMALKEIIDAADGDGWNQLDASFKKARAAVTKAEGNL